MILKLGSMCNRMILVHVQKNHAARYESERIKAVVKHLLKAEAEPTYSSYHHHQHVMSNTLGQSYHSAYLGLSNFYLENFVNETISVLKSN